MAIISISGKINSGKDTVGQIIQYLSLPEHEMANFDTFIHEYNNKEWDTTWEIKKWADKLKDIVCILIGCTREQLEDRDFKETPLGPEWDKWGFTTHYLGEQVDRIEENGLHIDKDAARKAERNMRISMRWAKSLESKFERVQMTPRLMLQLLGTDCGRDIIHPNVWVNSLMADYKWDKKSMTNGWVPTYNNPDNSGFDTPAEPIMPNWLITDTRFPNEAGAVLGKNGLLIRINRGDGNTGSHASETALDSYRDWNYVIDNNGTLEQLVDKIRRILKKENII